MKQFFAWIWCAAITAMTCAQPTNLFAAKQSDSLSILPPTHTEIFSGRNTVAVAVSNYGWLSGDTVMLLFDGKRTEKEIIAAKQAPLWKKRLFVPPDIPYFIVGGLYPYHDYTIFLFTLDPITHEPIRSLRWRFTTGPNEPSACLKEYEVEERHECVSLVIPFDPLKP